ncbi:putative MFS multidrug transporter [Leptodontidium sp. 2 PMI_412]|nr:putative MFS multidrug transporter [Leptodontidium sp. 2 PMI_412]
MVETQDQSRVAAPTPTEQSPLLSNHSNNDENDISSSHEEEALTGLSTLQEPSNREIALTMICIWLGTFMAALDSTIIATLVPPISTSFSSFTALSWLASAYLIANAACQPLSGRLTDIFSRRSGLLFSNIFFGIGTLICGLSTSAGMIIAGRVIAGMGGGGLTAISTFVASDLIPLRRRGLWQGIGNIFWGLGSGIGGIFGGWVNDVWGWRWAFLIQVPFIIISTFLVFFRVKVPVVRIETPSIKRVDFLGAITLVLALVLLLFGLNAGGNTVPWTHPLVLTTLPLSTLLFGVFVYVEEKIASEPIIPVRLLLDRTVASTCLVNWLNTMATFGLIFYGSLYFQAAMGLSPAESGARLIPQSLGTAIGSLGAGLIMRSTGKYYWLNAAIEASFVLACGSMCTLALTTPAWLPFINFALSGICYGGMLTVNLSALIAAVDHSHQAVITSASYTFRSTGATLGITAASAIFQNLLKTQLWARLGDREGAAEVIRRVRGNIEEGKLLPENWRIPIVESYMVSLRGVFFFCLGLSILSFMIGLAMKERKLHGNLARK